MRTSRNIFLFTILNLIATIVFIFQLPENVVFGFLSNFYANQFINRWYDLMIPIAQIIAAFVIMMIDIYKPNVPHKYRYVTSWVAISFTTFLMWFIMFIQYENLVIGKIVHWPLTVVILFPIALFMLADGYVKLYKDIKEFSLFGFKGVRNNPTAWNRVHSFAGKILMFIAIVFLALAVINEIIWQNNWIYLIAFVIWFVFYYLITTIYALSFKDND